MAKTRYTYKFRLYPNYEQQCLFAKTFGCCRFIYNKMLETKIEYYEQNNKMIRNHPSMYKNEFPFLKEVDSIALSFTQLYLEHAFRNFFRNPTVHRCPRYKVKRGRESYTTYSHNGFIKIIQHHIKLPKVGMVKLRDHRTIEGKIKSVTVVKQPDGKYYANILTERDVDSFPHSNKIVGIDIGLKDLVVTQNGVKYENPKAGRKYEKKLARERRRLSRKQMGSKNREKQRIIVARVYSKIVNLRKDCIHKITHSLISENQIVGAENLNVKSLVLNNRYSRSREIRDASWSELLRQLSYKAQWYGRIFVKVDRLYPSSQKCSNCGFVNPAIKNLSIREWICPRCGKNHDRDINAAMNIYSKTLEVIQIKNANMTLGQELPEVTLVEST